MSDYQNDRMKRKLGILPPLPTRKEKKKINPVSPKRAAQIKEEKEGGDTKLDKWFEERRLEMTGRCCLCNSKSERDNDETYRRSIHHLFEKRPTMFPSVSLHSDNWLELCFWGENACHTNIHNGTITWDLLMDSAEGVMILEKAKKIIPFIHENERKNIPDVLLKVL